MRPHPRRELPPHRAANRKHPYLCPWPIIGWHDGAIAAYKDSPSNRESHARLSHDHRQRRRHLREHVGL